MRPVYRLVATRPSPRRDGSDLEVDDGAATLDAADRDDEGGGVEGGAGGAVHGRGGSHRLVGLPGNPLGLGDGSEVTLPAQIMGDDVGP